MPTPVLQIHRSGLADLHHVVAAWTGRRTTMTRVPITFNNNDVPPPMAIKASIRVDLRKAQLRRHHRLRLITPPRLHLLRPPRTLVRRKRFAGSTHHRSTRAGIVHVSRSAMSMHGSACVGSSFKRIGSRRALLGCSSLLYSCGKWPAAR